MAEFAVGDGFTPRHFGVCTEGSLYVSKEEIAVIACYIAERHIGVEESESIVLVVGKLLIENAVEVFVVERCTTNGKVVVYFVREG